MNAVDGIIVMMLGNESIPLIILKFFVYLFIPIRRIIESKLKKERVLGSIQLGIFYLSICTCYVDLASHAKVLNFRYSFLFDSYLESENV